MKYKMEDALECIIDYRGKTPKKSDSGIMTLSAKSVRDGYIDYSQCYYISSQEYERFMVRGFPKVGDVLMTTEAPLGTVARLDRADVALAQRLLTLRGKEGILDTGYLYCYLRSPEGQRKLKERQTGTTVTGIKQAEFRKIEIDIPDYKTQKQIAYIVEVIERKIQNNNRMIKNLELQAFTYFNNMLEKSVSEVSVKDIAFVNSTRSLSKGQVARYVGMADLSTTSSYPENWSYAPYKGGMKFKNGDTIIARITPCLENGKTAYINFLNGEEIAFGSTEYVVLTPKPGIPAELLYCLARNEEFRNYAIKNMNGSSGRQRVSGMTIGDYSLKLPEKGELQLFSAYVKPLFELVLCNGNQNRSLIELRNTLLPKLISGEVDVSDLSIN